MLSKKNNGMFNLESLREQVYKYLRGEINSGHIQPDTVLNIKELSQRIGVSTTPLRDALIRLEVEGFVTILPRRGVVVNRLTLEDIRDFYQLAGAIEGSVMKEVFTLFKPNHITFMHQINLKMREALKADDFQVYYHLNISFHNVFLKLSENNYLQRLLMPMKQRLYDFQQRPYVKDWEFRKCDEHDQLIDHIEKKDSDGAIHCIRDLHWSFIAQEPYIRKFYRFILDAKS